jgi:hypothetical protein
MFICSFGFIATACEKEKDKVIDPIVMDEATRTEVVNLCNSLPIRDYCRNGGFNANTAVFRGSYDINNVVNGINNKVSKNEEKTLYSSCESEVFDEYMKDITINDIMNQTFNKDIFIMYIKLDFNTIEEEFEEDYKLWVRTHNNINKQKMSDDWKFENEPKRTMKLILSNKEFELVNCKILEVSNNGLFVLIEEIKDVK